MPKYRPKPGMSFSSESRLYRRFHRQAADEQLRRRELSDSKYRRHFLEFELRPDEGCRGTTYKDVFGITCLVCNTSEYRIALCIVCAVVPGGVAERQGLIVGDIICEMNKNKFPLKMQAFMFNDIQFTRQHTMTVLGNNPIRLLHQDDQNFVNFLLGAQRRHRIAFLRNSLENDPYAFMTLDFNVTHPQTQNQFRVSVVYYSYTTPLTRNAYLGTGDIITSINGINVFGERNLNDSLSDIISQMGIPKTVHIEIIPTSVLRRYPTAPESDIMQHSVVTRPSLLIGPPSSLEERFSLQWGWPPANPGRISRSQSVSDVSTVATEENEFVRPGPSNAVASAARKPLRLRHRRASFDGNA